MAVSVDRTKPLGHGQPEEPYYDLGSYRRSVTANNEQAQSWFNRGLLWCYGFNHEEAITCFERAVACDSDCAMAYWGIAYALGPNYNKPWEYFDATEKEETLQRTHRAVSKAKQRAETASPVEKALVYALDFRYPRDHADQEHSIWNKSYAGAMEKVYNEFPDDLDVAALCVDAMMNLSPWRLWDLQTGEPASGSRTLDAKAILDRTLANEAGMEHPGLLHLYIHLMEMSPTPEAAKVAADRLRTMASDAGHLLHMPSHIDMLLGDYTLAIASNQRAMQADKRFLARSGPLNFYTLYRMHDYHFCIYAAMFAGQSKTALDTVSRLEESVPDEVLRVKSPPMADWLEGILAVRVHALVRFGRWQDIIDLQLPEDQELYCTTTAMMHYAKAVALAAFGKIDGAERERESFLEARKLVPGSRMLFNNKCVDVLGVAESMMDGELQYRRGDYEGAFNHLREAIARDDGLPYDEPWGWMQPTRHAYGALLMERNRLEEAATVYAEDLGLDGKLPRALRHPNNVWALHGYHECLVRLGRESEADRIAPQLKAAMSKADVPIKASCFCRLGAM
ncbi:TPR domain protein [Xylariales sp. AK1849]|nr:TPR domain protein [Xylariales sp. AK1849]